MAGQRDDYTEGDAEAALADAERRISARVTIALRWLQQQVPASRWEEAIRTGKVPELLEEVRANLERAGKAIAAEVNEVYIESGKDIAAVVASKTGAPASWSPANPTAAARMASQEIELVGSFTDEQMATIRSVLVEQVANATNPRVAAIKLEDSIGLAPLHQEWVDSYRALLESGSADDLAAAKLRELRGKRFDRIVNDALEEERGLTRDTIERMVSVYRDNAIRYRAQVIATTSGFQAIHQGHEDAMRAAIESGDIAGAVQFWNVTIDGRERKSHHVMQRQERLFGQPFTSGDGILLEFPHDPNAPIEETAGCRCMRTFRLLIGPETEAGD